MSGAVPTLPPRTSKTCCLIKHMVTFYMSYIVSTEAVVPFVSCSSHPLCIARNVASTIVEGLLHSDCLWVLILRLLDGPSVCRFLWTMCNSILNHVSTRFQYGLLSGQVGPQDIEFGCWSPYNNSHIHCDLWWPITDPLALWIRCLTSTLNGNHPSPPPKPPGVTLIKV